MKKIELLVPCVLLFFIWGWIIAQKSGNIGFAIFCAWFHQRSRNDMSERNFADSDKSLPHIELMSCLEIVRLVSKSTI